MLPEGFKPAIPSKRSTADPRLRVKTHSGAERGGAERPADCDLIRGNKSN